MPSSPTLRMESPAICISRGERVRRALRRLASPYLVLLLATVEVSHRFYIDCGARWVLLAGLLATAAYWLVGIWRGRAPPGTVEATAGVISCGCDGAVRRIAVADLAHGWLSAYEGLWLRAGDGTEIWIACSAEEAAGLLEVAGLGATERVARIPMASAPSQTAGGEVLATFGLFVSLVVATHSAFSLLTTIRNAITGEGSHSFLEVQVLDRLGWSALWVVLCVSFSIGLGMLLRERELVVGSDGVAFARRFTPYRDIRSVEPYGWGVHLALRDGRAIDLPLRARGAPALPSHPPPPGSAAAFDFGLRAALLARIEAARASRGAAPEGQSIDALSRRDLPAKEWVARLRGLLSRGAYRYAAADPAALGAVAADPAASSEQRIAAALALSASDAPEDKRRLRIAVETCADAELRAALEEAAAGEISERKLQRVIGQQAQ